MAPGLDFLRLRKRQANLSNAIEDLHDLSFGHRSVRITASAPLWFTTLVRTLNTSPRRRKYLEKAGQIVRAFLIKTLLPFLFCLIPPLAGALVAVAIPEAALRDYLDRVRHSPMD